MKKFLTQQINFTYAIIVMLVLVIGVSKVSAGYAVPGDVNNIDPIIHVGGGAQATDSLRLGSHAGPTGNLDINENTGAALFDSTNTGGFFSVLYNAAFLGNVYISNNIQSAVNSWGTINNGLTTPIQRVNVDGNVLITSLENAIGNKDVCVTKNGTLTLCPDQSGTLGTCGLSAGHSYTSPPSTNLCSSGTASAVTTNATTYDWDCVGTSGTASCQANIVVQTNGLCGPAEGHSYSTPPTSGLCSSGIEGAVQTNTNTYTWTCSGTNGGTDDLCSTPRTIAVNGSCEVFNSGPYATQPANSSNGCIDGSYSDLSDTSSLWKWECLGSNGGTNASPCTADVTPVGNPSCYPYAGSYTQQPATNSLSGCTAGTYSDTSDTSLLWKWNCTENAVTVNCTADKNADTGYYFVCGSNSNLGINPGGTYPIADWTRGPLYNFDGTGDYSPYNLGSLDCSNPVQYNGTQILLDPSNANSTTYNGKPLLYQYFCSDGVPPSCACSTLGNNEAIC